MAVDDKVKGNEQPRELSVDDLTMMESNEGHPAVSAIQKIKKEEAQKPVPPGYAIPTPDQNNAGRGEGTGSTPAQYTPQPKGKAYK